MPCHVGGISSAPRNFGSGVCATVAARCIGRSSFSTPTASVATADSTTFTTGSGLGTQGHR
jgi:hypothetical protein